MLKAHDFAQTCQCVLSRILMAESIYDACYYVRLFQGTNLLVSYRRAPHSSWQKARAELNELPLEAEAW